MVKNAAESGASATSTGADSVLNGIDVASGQHPDNKDSDIDWPDVAAAGYQFAAVKATEGNYYVNPFYASDASNATAAGMYVSPYAFANPYGSGSASPPNGTAAQQADYAAGNAGAAQNSTGADYTAGGKYLPLLLDLEDDPYTSTETNSNDCYGLSASSMVSWISSFMSEADKDTGAEPIIYTSQSWWNSCTDDSTAFGSDALWVAAYAVGTPGTLPSGWNTWNMWQYTDEGTVGGVSGAVDLDYFDGVPETMQTQVNTSATPVQVRTLSGLAGDRETYTATGLPPGTSISSSGRISGTPTVPGRYDVTITPSGSGPVLPATLSFTWVVSWALRVAPPKAPVPATASPAPPRVATPGPLPPTFRPAPPAAPSDDR
jgi:GH25 family lysozyme M1 (1,4-beta-N-acetylmuramidase)